EWSDGKGSFAGRADWNRETNSADFQVRSSLDLKAFLDAFELGEPLAGIEFHSTPLLEISGSVNFGANRFQPHIIGHAAFGHFSYKTVPFSDLAADFSWAADRTFVRDLHVPHPTFHLSPRIFDS